jgi:hypothetical protein
MPYWGNGAPLSLPSPALPAGRAFLSPTLRLTSRLTSGYVQLMSLKAPPRIFATRACGAAVPAFKLKLFRVCVPAEPLSRRLMLVFAALSTSNQSRAQLTSVRNKLPVLVRENDYTKPQTTLKRLTKGKGVLSMVHIFGEWLMCRVPKVRWQLRQ